MRKWVKVVIGSAGVLAAAAAGGGAAEWLRVRRTPAWYAPDRSTPQQRAVAADRFQDTLARLYDWSADRHARRLAGRPSPTTADATHPLSFTDAQLNAFLDRWSDLQDRRATIEQYVHDPRVIVVDGRVILAAQVKEMGLVVSLFVQPAVAADGRLRLTLDKVVAGVVPVPDAFFANQRASLEHVLSSNLPADQAAARLDADGLANGSAATAAMDEMLLAMLRGQAAEPVIFVPVNTSASSLLLPVRITAVTAQDHTLAITALAMSPDDRRDLLARIKTADQADAVATH